MIPDQAITKKCSECSGLIFKHSIASGNTFGATFWSDGKMDAPMLPDYPSLVKCPHCRMPVWIDDLEFADEVDPIETNNANPQDPLQLDLDDYVSFLDNNKLTPDAEQEVRIRAWWSGNDERRKGLPLDFTEIEINNLNALTPLLDESDDNERLMKAETMREQGKFDQALELLDHPFGEDFTQAVSAIRIQAQQRDPMVGILNLR